MKKIVALLLAMAMVFALAACSQSNPAPAPAAEPAAAPAAAAPAAEPAAAPEPAAEPAPAPVEAKVMKIAGTMSQAETDGEYNGTKKFAELVEKYTNGTIKCEIYPSSQLGGQTEFSEGVMNGSIEACVLGPSYFGVIDPFMYFLEMPYLFEDLNHARALWENDNPALQEIKAHEEALGLIQVGTLYRSPRVWCNNIRPVKTVADNKGIKMRVPESPISTALCKAMGANPVTVAWAEVYTGLQSGLTDGVENAITELKNNNMHEVVKYCSETNHMLNSQGIMVSKEWYDALTPEEQKAVMQAGLEATQWRAEQLNSEVEACWAAFEEKGVEVIRHADLDNTAFSAAAQVVYDEYIANGSFTQEFIDSIRALAK